MPGSAVVGNIAAKARKLLRRLREGCTYFVHGNTPPRSPACAAAAHSYARYLSLRAFTSLLAARLQPFMENSSALSIQAGPTAVCVQAHNAKSRAAENLRSGGTTSTVKSCCAGK